MHVKTVLNEDKYTYADMIGYARFLEDTDLRQIETCFGYAFDGDMTYDVPHGLAIFYGDAYENSLFDDFFSMIREVTLEGEFLFTIEDEEYFRCIFKDGVWEYQEGKITYGGGYCKQLVTEKKYHDLLTGSYGSELSL